jgi:hypothetical protein
MPPYCDTRNGPVVQACRRALETGNVKHALIWIPPGAEPELAAAFERTVRVRSAGGEARALADDWFFETAVRLHRAGEGEPFTGLKPAGLDEGPVVPMAEHAIETGDPFGVIGFLVDAVGDDLRHRFGWMRATRAYDPDDVVAGRGYVQAFLDFVVYAHHLHASVTGGSHAHGGGGHRD